MRTPVRVGSFVRHRGCGGSPSLAYSDRAASRAYPERTGRRMRTQLLVTLRSIVPAVVLCVGCASIEAFSANPRTACAGDAVTVTWAAVGDVTIGSEPAVADIG